MCNCIQRPLHSCESHAWDIKNLTPARVTQLWIRRSHYPGPEPDSAPQVSSDASSRRPPRVSPRRRPPPCPNPCPAIRETRLSSTGVWGQERSSLLQVGAGWAALGAVGDGGTGDGQRREKHTCLSPWRAPSPAAMDHPALWQPEWVPSTRSPSASAELCGITAGGGDTPLLSQASWPSCPGGHPAWLMHVADSKQGCHNFFFNIKFLYRISPGFG